MDEEETDEEATDEEATDEEATDEEATNEEATDEDCHILPLTGLNAFVYTLYRLKCSKAISGWLDGRMEISVRPYFKRTCGANNGEFCSGQFCQNLLSCLAICHR